MRKWKTTHAAIGLITSEVIASRVATTDFAASSTKGDRHDECRCPVRSGSPYSHDAAASGVTGALLAAGADFLESLLVLPVALMRLLGLSKLTQLTKGEEHACASVVRD